jgi:hypothetical protein
MCIIIRCGHASPLLHISIFYLSALTSLRRVLRAVQRLSADNQNTHDRAELAARFDAGAEATIAAALASAKAARAAVRSGGRRRRSVASSVSRGVGSRDGDDGGSDGETWSREEERPGQLSAAVDRRAHGSTGGTASVPPLARLVRPPSARPAQAGLSALASPAAAAAAATTTAPGGGSGQYDPFSVAAAAADTAQRIAARLARCAADRERRLCRLRGKWRA